MTDLAPEPEMIIMADIASLAGFYVNFKATPTPVLFSDKRTPAGSNHSVKQNNDYIKYLLLTGVKKINKTITFVPVFRGKA